MAWFAAETCSRDGLSMNSAKCEAVRATSGRVVIAAYKMDPIRCCSRVSVRATTLLGSLYIPV